MLWLLFIYVQCFRDRVIPYTQDRLSEDSRCHKRTSCLCFYDKRKNDVTDCLSTYVVRMPAIVVVNCKLQTATAVAIVPISTPTPPKTAVSTCILYSHSCSLYPSSEPISSPVAALGAPPKIGLYTMDPSALLPAIFA